MPDPPRLPVNHRGFHHWPVHTSLPGKAVDLPQLSHFTEYASKNSPSLGLQSIQLLGEHGAQLLHGQYPEDDKYKAAMKVVGNYGRRIILPVLVSDLEPSAASLAPVREANRTHKVLFVLQIIMYLLTEGVKLSQDKRIDVNRKMFGPKPKKKKDDEEEQSDSDAEMEEFEAASGHALRVPAHMLKRCFGNAEDPGRFFYQYNTEGDIVELPRFTLDQQTVWEPSGSEYALGDTPEVILLHLTVNDPRIDLGAGVQRLVKENLAFDNKSGRQRGLNGGVVHTTYGDKRDVASSKGQKPGDWTHFPPTALKDLTIWSDALKTVRGGSAFPGMDPLKALATPDVFDHLFPAGSLDVISFSKLGPWDDAFERLPGIIKEAMPQPLWRKGGELTMEPWLEAQHVWEPNRVVLHAPANVSAPVGSALAGVKEEDENMQLVDEEAEEREMARFVVDDEEAVLGEKKKKKKKKKKLIRKGSASDSSSSESESESDSSDSDKEEETPLAILHAAIVEDEEAEAARDKEEGDPWVPPPPPPEESSENKLHAHHRFGGLFAPLVTYPFPETVIRMDVLWSHPRALMNLRFPFRNLILGAGELELVPFRGWTNKVTFPPITERSGIPFVQRIELLRMGGIQPEANADGSQQRVEWIAEKVRDEIKAGRMTADEAFASLCHESRSGSEYQPPPFQNIFAYIESKIAMADKNEEARLDELREAGVVDPDDARHGESLLFQPFPDYFCMPSPPKDASDTRNDPHAWSMMVDPTLSIFSNFLARHCMDLDETLGMSHLHAIAILSMTIAMSAMDIREGLQILLLLTGAPSCGKSFICEGYLIPMLVEATLIQMAKCSNTALESGDFKGLMAYFDENPKVLSLFKTTADTVQNATQGDSTVKTMLTSGYAHRMATNMDGGRSVDQIKADLRRPIQVCCNGGDELREKMHSAVADRVFFLVVEHLERPEQELKEEVNSWGYRHVQAMLRRMQYAHLMLASMCTSDSTLYDDEHTDDIFRITWTRFVMEFNKLSGRKMKVNNKRMQGRIAKLARTNMRTRTWLEACAGTLSPFCAFDENGESEETSRCNLYSFSDVRETGGVERDLSHWRELADQMVATDEDYVHAISMLSGVLLPRSIRFITEHIVSNLKFSSRDVLGAARFQSMNFMVSPDGQKDLNWIDVSAWVEGDTSVASIREFAAKAASNLVTSEFSKKTGVEKNSVKLFLTLLGEEPIAYNPYVPYEQGGMCSSVQTVEKMVLIKDKQKMDGGMFNMGGNAPGSNAYRYYISVHWLETQVKALAVADPVKTALEATLNYRGSREQRIALVGSTYVDNMAGGAMMPQFLHVVQAGFPTGDGQQEDMRERLVISSKKGTEFCDNTAFSYGYAEKCAMERMNAIREMNDLVPFVELPSDDSDPLTTLDGKLHFTPASTVLCRRTFEERVRMQLEVRQRTRDLGVDVPMNGLEQFIQDKCAGGSGAYDEAPRRDMPANYYPENFMAEYQAKVAQSKKRKRVGWGGIFGAVRPRDKGGRKGQGGAEMPDEEGVEEDVEEEEMEDEDEKLARSMFIDDEAEVMG